MRLASFILLFASSATAADIRPLLKTCCLDSRETFANAGLAALYEIGGITSSDATGVLPGGQTFNGPAELRSLLTTRHQDEFITNLARRLTSFALGRALKPEDEGLIRSLPADLKKADHRADAPVESIVLSEAFRTPGATD